jgi:hypothetical protein
MDFAGLPPRLRAGCRVHASLWRIRRPTPNWCCGSRKPATTTTPPCSVPDTEVVRLLDREHRHAERTAGCGQGCSARPRRGVGGADAGVRRRSAVALSAPGSTTPRWSFIAAGCSAWFPKSYLLTYGKFTNADSSPRRRCARRYPDGRRECAVRTRPAVHCHGHARIRAARRDLRGHVRAGAWR